MINSILLFTVGEDTALPKRISVTIDEKYYYKVESEYDHYCSIVFVDKTIGKTIKINNLDGTGSLDVGSNQIWIKTPDL